VNQAMKDKASELGWFIAIGMFLFCAGIGIGGNFSDEQIAKRCKLLGKFDYKDTGYECRELKRVE
jgi:hypothetical protein